MVSNKHIVNTKISWTHAITNLLGHKAHMSARRSRIWIHKERSVQPAPSVINGVSIITFWGDDHVQEMPLPNFLFEDFSHFTMFLIHGGHWTLLVFGDPHEDTVSLLFRENWFLCGGFFVACVTLLQIEAYIKMADMSQVISHPFLS